MRLVMTVAFVGVLAGEAVVTLPPGAAAAARTRPVVVELYTSEACSSCPPAEEFLRALAARDADVLPLAFHVTYWNGPFWTDPFAFGAATERQRDYARTLGNRDIYTPEMVVDGVSGFVGSDRMAGDAAIGAGARAGAADALTLSLDGNDLVVRIGAGRGGARVLVVGYDRAHDRRIGGGENDGARIVEANVVRSLAEAGTWSGRPALFRLKRGAGETFAVLLQTPDGHIVDDAVLGPAA